MRPSFLLIFSLFCLVVIGEAAIKPGVMANQELAEVVAVDANVQSVLQQASALRLAQHQTWLALLHYKHETFLQRSVSQADGSLFFLSENGKTDAGAELNADIRAFLSTKKFSQKEGQNEVHAQCLFPARWWWLKQQLNLSMRFDVACPRLDVFMARVANDKLYMVFPSMYLNNPGSMFGHTFLRFDSNEESILLSQTLNYAARVDEHEDIVSYVSKGLFGGYTGFFRARPYFETVQEYSNIENRDIWEYQLAFSKEEIRQLVRHVWEVRGIDFDYYFFRENCAYRILALLDVIRPDMRLTTDNSFPVYALPVDTVRALDEVGLLQERKFRASLATQINDSFANQSDEATTSVLKISAEETAGDSSSIEKLLDDVSSNAGKMSILNQSYTILQFRNKSATKKSQNILALISTFNAENISLTDVEAAVLDSDKISPEKGHKSLRFSIGYGEQNNREYLDIGFRLAFHDLLDAPQGFIDGAAINVFDLRFKWFEPDNLILESLSVFNVTSLNPIKRWQKPLSWMFDFRFDRTQFSDTQSARNFMSKGGMGLSIRHKAFMPFVLLIGEWNISSSYNKGYSLLLGLQAGLHYSYLNNQVVLSYESDDAVSGFDLDKNITQLQWQYNMQINHAFRLAYKRTQYDFYNDEDWSLVYNYYF